MCAYSYFGSDKAFVFTTQGGELQVYEACARTCLAVCVCVPISFPVCPSALYALPPRHRFGASGANTYYQLANTDSMAMGAGGHFAFYLVRPMPIAQRVRGGVAAETA